jgi:hypothetical protein
LAEQKRERVLYGVGTEIGAGEQFLEDEDIRAISVFSKGLFSSYRCYWPVEEAIASSSGSATNTTTASTADERQQKKNSIESLQFSTPKRQIKQNI